MERPHLATLQWRISLMLLRTEHYITQGITALHTLTVRGTVHSNLEKCTLLLLFN